MTVVSTDVGTGSVVLEGLTPVGAGKGLVVVAGITPPPAIFAAGAVVSIAARSAIPAEVDTG